MTEYPSHPDITYHFPEGFLWGTATSGHQVEGNNTNNDWWAWEQYVQDHQTNEIFENQNSGMACDWWEGGKAEADIQLMADLNTNSHRLSIEWSRVEPEPGTWDEDAIARYRHWLELMVAAGIKPMVTLFHFTAPIWMAQDGGWLNEENILRFRRFAEKIVLEMGDLVDLWCTINEPNVYATQGFVKGVCPPHKQSASDYFTVVLNVMRAHAAAYEVLHQHQSHAQVGFAKHLVWWRPRWAWNPLDQAAFHLLKRNFNAITLDLLSAGKWRPIPGLGKSAYYPELRNTLDWFGVNYYHRYDAGLNLRSKELTNMIFMGRTGLEKGPKWWGELWPDGLFFLLEKIHRRFNLPIYITENGVPDPLDTHRPHFILDHLRRVWQATRMGIPVKGYYHWSLVDNFEWLEAYNPKFYFGLYAVDWETQERTPRTSAALYREIATHNLISSDLARRYAPESLEALLPGRTSLSQVSKHTLFGDEYETQLASHIHAEASNYPEGD